MDQMMKRALLIGIDEYPDSPLSGCVNDAKKIGRVLSRNEDGSPNFDCRYLLSSEVDTGLSSITQAVERLFSTEADVAVLYYSGHGAISESGGFLIPSDFKSSADGYPMHDILELIYKSPVREAVVIFDCCYSGDFGNLPTKGKGVALLREGMSVLAASGSSESAIEINGGGVFTSLVFDALNGGAADILGRVTVGSVYTYVDMALSAWDQRPMFKAHLSKFAPLRSCTPHVDAAIIRLLPAYFKTPDTNLPLDPSYEPTTPPRDEVNERTFLHLQKLRDARLLIPIDEEHLYFAAINSKACQLTALGKFYWNLAKQGRV